MYQCECEFCTYVYVYIQIYALSRYFSCRNSDADYHDDVQYNSVEPSSFVH